NPTSTYAGVPTCAASTSSTPSGSSKAPSAGPHQHYRSPNKPTAGPGWSPPPTPNCAWPAGSSTTNACPGNDPATPPSSPQPASAEGFNNSAQPSPQHPARPNTPKPDPGAQKHPT